ncbi:disulfide bond formation protein DsbA [Nocardia sp. NPDC050408]|uniref:mycothiol-dependent nitroreductase Rv2466c family protein n=2 Tax=unclassified Nocardia TaxID=2637762 RepID=UPI003793C124
MAAIDLYLDPVCPFGWVAAQWLLDAANEHRTPVTLRQMSLAVLNDGNDVDSHHRPMIDRSRRLGRLFAAVTDQHGPDGFARLYRAFGASAHDQREEVTLAAIADILQSLGMDRSLADTLDASELDQAVADAHEVSQQVLGGRGGSPIIAIDGHGFFGPVLTRIPDVEKGAALLDALIIAARTPEFAALQRPYSGPPTTEREQGT